MVYVFAAKCVVCGHDLLVVVLCSLEVFVGRDCSSRYLSVHSVVQNVLVLVVFKLS